MKLVCSRRMLNFLEPEKLTDETPIDFFSWCIDFQMINRRKLVFLMHAQTRFCVILYGLTKKDFTLAKELFPLAIFETMIFMGYPFPLVRKYCEALGEVTYSPSKDRKLIAQLYRAVMHALFYVDDNLSISSRNQVGLSKQLNECPVGSNQWKIVHFPFEKMEQMLWVWAGIPLAQTGGIKN